MMATFIPYLPPDIGRSRHSSSTGSALIARHGFKRPATTLDLTARTRNVAVQFRRVTVPDTSETSLSPVTKGQAALGTRGHSDEGWDSDGDLPPLSELLAHNPKAADAFRLYRRLQPEPGSRRVTDGGSVAPCASIGSASGPLLGSSQEEPFVVDSDEDSSEGEEDYRQLLGDSRKPVPGADAVVEADKDKGEDEDGDEDIDAFPLSIPAGSIHGDLTSQPPPRSKVDIQGTNEWPQKEGDFRVYEGSYADLASSVHPDLSTPFSVPNVDSTPEHRNVDGLPPASAGHVHDIFAELHERSTEQGSVSDNVGRRGQPRHMSPSVPSICEQSPGDYMPSTIDEMNCDVRLDGSVSVDCCLDSKGVGDDADKYCTAGADPRHLARYSIGSQAPPPEPLDVVSPANDDVLPIQPNLHPRKGRLSYIEPSKAIDTLRSERRSLRVARPSWKKRAADEAKAQNITGTSVRVNPKRRKRLQAQDHGGTLSLHREKLDIEDVFLGDNGSIQCVVRPRSFLLAKEKLIGQELHRRCEELFKKRYG